MARPAAISGSPPALSRDMIDLSMMTAISAWAPHAWTDMPPPFARCAKRL
jgi:hypothetical protein